MKTVLFCGGRGTRIQDNPENLPKPLVPVHGKPIVRHIMDYYTAYGAEEFILTLGYRADVFHDYFDRPENLTPGHDHPRNTLVDTGVDVTIAERLYAVRDQLRNEEFFCANYSDVLTNAPLDAMIEAFRASDKVACFLSVPLPTSFHFVDTAPDGSVRSIDRSASMDLWINGGYFLLRPEVFNYIEPGDELVERPFARMIEDNALMSWRHKGFWRPMDTQADRRILENMAHDGICPWELPQQPAKVA